MSHVTVLIATFLLSATMAGDQAKPAAKTGAKPAAATAALQGTWVMTSMNGQAPPAGEPELTLTFAGDTYHQTVGGKVNERGTIKVDGTKKPMTIDLLITEGSDANKTQLGIFEVTGDTLKAAFGAPGATQRPTDFSGKDGFIAVMKKQKKG
jgi:uncharacterized protein (TIGR03067 family)